VLSACEQRSVKAERQIKAIKKARFMSQHLGEEFDGVISSVTKFGIFVLLRQFDVDGLVRVEELGDDYFEYDEENLRLVGRKSGMSYEIGELVKVTVAKTDIEQGQIDLVLTGVEKRQPSSNPWGSKRPSGDKERSDRRPEQRHDKGARHRGDRHKEDRHKTAGHKKGDRPGKRQEERGRHKGKEERGPRKDHEENQRNNNERGPHHKTASKQPGRLQFTSAARPKRLADFLMKRDDQSVDESSKTKKRGTPQKDSGSVRSTRVSKRRRPR